ncbi:putative pilus assembly protein FilE [Acinetobacter sp. ANC 3882]|uniref:putative pilus assembly protein FilE n=1 Tax=Acinetobacter sp. ANC 3882 TaxID=2923423 RepID=UPI001F4AC4DC|nr:putative pilus assembly protein FilE [Acinetobacter sp. ANC 3882]MCH7315307.1 putative pilus assembly protein FilE [Acinetobacter sp. ANC 3882]
MQKKKTQQSTLAISLLFLMVSSASTVYADGFYTIIGPDGRPMVVPMKVAKKEPEPNKHTQPVNSEKLPPPIIQNNNTEKKIPPTLNQQKADDVQQLESKQKQLNIIQKVEVVEPVHSQQIVVPKVIEQSTISSKNKTVVPTVLEKSLPAKVEKPAVTQGATNTSVIDKPILESKAIVVNKSQISQTNIATPKETDVSTGFSQVDGVDYVNNEYLENQEFNLDGKKRFYTMPDGTGRLETIERKKGVSRSVLDKLLNRSQQSTAPIALSSTYVRLSSEDLKSAFENDRCFLEDYKKSIKTLSLNKDVGLWPRKPLKEKFEYELIKLDTPIQYMQIDSYASSNEKPVYYWPLIVFLDEKGCIEEGVSGFKNSKTVGTVLQHSALQGVIKIPQDVRYIMMTPLASAVDVSEQELTNQGQIKISVLQ